MTLADLQPTEVMALRKFGILELYAYIDLLNQRRKEREEQQKKEERAANRQRLQKRRTR